MTTFNINLFQRWFYTSSSVE